MDTADAAWLHMERPENLMVINGVFELEGELPLEEIRALVRERLLRFQRFRERVLDVDSSHPRWEPDAEFDPDRHVRAGARLEGPDAVRRAVESHVSEPLALDRPPWVIHVFPGDGRTLLLARVHHCMADGIALIRVILTISDEHAQPEPAPSRRKRARSRLGKLLAVARHPLAPVRHAYGLARTVVELTLRPADPPSALQGRLHAKKKVAWSRTFELGAIKKVAKARGAKVNDVLTAAVAGALRRYLSERGEVPPQIRAMVPVNLRPPDQAAKLGNFFGLVMLPLPLGESDGFARVDASRRGMDRAKGTQEAIVAFLVLRGLGLLSRRLEAPFVRFFGAKASAVMTNVPGPRERLHMRGHAIRWVMFWVPQSGSLSLGISVLSYAGGVVLGVMSDAGIVSDPERIAAAFEEELEELERRANASFVDGSASRHVESKAR